MKGSESIYILDTSALLALIEGEEGVDVFQDVLENAILIHKDPEFEDIDDDSLKDLKLPYKS